MSIKILEFRQKDSRNVISNGYYENTLNGDVIEINEGDVVSIKNVFLDTTQENQYSFPNDVNLVIDYGVYIVDWNDDDAKQNYENSDGNKDTPRYLTGEVYLPYKDIQGQPLDPNIYQFVQGLSYNALPFVQPSTN